jgi:hypothetical protein
MIDSGQRGHKGTLVVQTNWLLSGGLHLVAKNESVVPLWIYGHAWVACGGHQTALLTFSWLQPDAIHFRAPTALC